MQKPLYTVESRTLQSKLQISQLEWTSVSTVHQKLLLLEMVQDHFPSQSSAREVDTAGSLVPPSSACKNGWRIHKLGQKKSTSVHHRNTKIKRRLSWDNHGEIIVGTIILLKFFGWFKIKWQKLTIYPPLHTWLYIFNSVIRLKITLSNNMIWDSSSFKNTHEKEQNYIIVSC